MNEWFKKIIGRIKETWSKWKLSQKIILISIVVVVVVALILVITLSTRSTEVVLYNKSFDDATNTQIITRLQNENISAKQDATGKIVVKDNVTAKAARDLLFREGIVDTSNADVWDIFGESRWTETDFERNEKKRRTIVADLERIIKSYDVIDDVIINYNPPKESTFANTQEPKSISVMVKLKPNGEVDKKQVKTWQKLIKASIPGLTDENIVISDSRGTTLNDFEGLEDVERVDITKREQKFISDEEKRVSEKIRNTLLDTFKDRLGSVNVTIEMDMSEQTYEQTEYSAIVKKPDNPDTPYDDSEIIETLPISEELINKSWTGTGYNPEGPAGVEGQNPPVYSDMSNLYGKSEESSVKKNHALNSKITKTVVHPQPGRRTASVLIDGTWNFVYDEKGNYKIDPKTGGRERAFTPVSAEDIAKAEDAMKNAMGFDRNRGDAVTVVAIQFDRTKEFQEADDKYRRAQQTKRTIFYVLIGIVCVLAVFLAIRFISKEMERRRRQKEEELLRQQQLAREQVLWDAEKAGMEVTMSVEEKKRAELQDNAITAAKDHPEDVAQLIRTWLMEE